MSTLSFRFTSSLALVLAAGASYVAAGKEELVGHLNQLETEHAELCPIAADYSDLPTRISALVNELRSQVGIAKEGLATVAALNGYVFGHLPINASQDLKDSCNLLPSRVLERRQGYCVGIAALYLLLAEQLGLPIYAVATPSHVFLRYDDGTTRINIETFQQGANLPTEQYIRDEKIPEPSIRKGVFMRNLTTDEFLAQVHNNLGVIYSERREYEKAASEYERVIDLHRRFPAAYYNFGNDLLQQREFRRAARLFSKSLRLYPTDVWALNNRGLAYLKMEAREDARLDFEQALRIDPAFEQARENLRVLAAPSGVQ